MSTAIPEEFHGLLQSDAIAFVATLGKNGEPQVTPMWFLWEGGQVCISLVEGRQKLRNLQRDARISVVIVNPMEPTKYIELRGTIDALVEDPERNLESRIAVKYVGHDVDIEPPGTMRYATRVLVEKTTSQNGI